MRILLLFASVCLIAYSISAQAQSNTNSNGSSSTAIPTAVPFLTISPDARSGALGEAGVAITPDANATYWNPSKLAFLNDGVQVALSYSPWLRHIVPNSSLSYLTIAKKLNERDGIGASLRYFNVGTADLYDANQNSTGTFNPYEFSVDVSVARKFGNTFSLGLSLRYIHSALNNTMFVQGQQNKTGNAIAADVSMYYKDQFEQSKENSVFAFGVNISNIGNKISYSDAGQSYFLPTNLKIGAANTWYLDDNSQVTFALDLNKLLVATPPLRDANGTIIQGKDDNISVPASIFGSFTDAPGGLSEELQEVSISPGVEFWYNQKFALRAGYFYESPNKGNRQYLTVGFGLKYNNIGVDFSYLSARQDKSPLANTLRFSLEYNFKH